MNTLGHARRAFAFVIPYEVGGTVRGAGEAPHATGGPESLPVLIAPDAGSAAAPAAFHDAAMPMGLEVPTLYYSLPGVERLPSARPLSDNGPLPKYVPLSGSGPSQGNSPLPSAAAPLPARVIWRPQPPEFGDYRRAFDIVQRHLQRGNSYLINLCFATPVRCNLTLEQMFTLAHAPYKLLVPGKFACFSPEPFVHMEGERIRTFPMKGTVRRQEDVPRLLADPKEESEHATVVDLLRNDLALVGRQVEVERYRYVERIPTQSGALYATSSLISAGLPRDWPSVLGDILFALLPAGSVTGAPKAWTCRAIAEAEALPRGYYTGIFGYFDGTSLRSAVSIRFVEQLGKDSFLYRSGGGITTLSRAEDEYRELCDKVYLPFASAMGSMPD